MELVVVEVNYQPLLLIFVFILVCKLLRSFLSPLVRLVLRQMTSSPARVEVLKNELSKLKEEMAEVSITDDFPTHSRLKRKQVAKETELGAIEGEHRSQLLKQQALVEALATVVLELVPLLVVVYWRSEAVVVLPLEHLWPLSGLLRFPTQVAGGVGSPVWALCSRQALQAVSTLFFKK